MKLKSKFAILALTAIVITGCNKSDEGTGSTTPSVAPTTAASTTTAPTTPDAVTTASIVNTEEAFEQAIGSNGTWIIATLNDLTFDKDLLLEGEYKNGKKDDAGKDIIQRKIALYTQDADRNITARFTLTAPKLTVTSPEASIQHGTFKGDLYVSVANFQLVDTIVEGNVYFTTEEAQSTFKMDETSKITGTQELKK